MSSRPEYQPQSGSNLPESAQLDWVEVVREQIASLRFGIVQITVHDSRVVQVEKTERLRFDKV